MDQKPNNAEPQKPRRRWFQFRLRTLLIGMGLLGIACCYVAHEWRIVEARKAIEARLGLGCETDWARRSLGVDADKAEEPGFVRRLMGDRKVFIINYWWTKTSESEIKEIEKDFPGTLVTEFGGIRR
jgi:hypothetical protein